MVYVISKKGKPLMPCKKGRMSSGYAVLMNFDGVKTDFSAMPKGCKTPKLANLKRTGARSSWMITTEVVTQNIA